MRRAAGFLFVCTLSLSLLSPAALSQSSSQLPPESATSATVPVTLDHNRIIIDVYLPLPDGTTKRVRGWVTTADPDLWMTERVAKLMGLVVNCEAQPCTAPAPAEVVVGDMKISLAAAKQARVLAAPAVRPGLSAEITLPSTVLRHFDVVVDYPNREFSLSPPASVLFEGGGPKMKVDPDSGLIDLPAVIATEKYSLLLDLGSSFSSLSADVVAQLHQAHTGWPYMTGSVGPANMWGGKEEAGCDVLRVSEIRVGTVNFTDVGVAALSKESASTIAPATGILGANALLNYRVGLDYAHGAIYLDKTSKFGSSSMDVIGLTLRPEPDGKYTVAGVPSFAGKPAVEGVNEGDLLSTIDKVPAAGGTMGQVWSLMGGRPGDTRTLVLERDGKLITVKATVQRFLAAAPAKSAAKPVARKPK